MSQIRFILQAIHSKTMTRVYKRHLLVTKQRNGYEYKQCTRCGLSDYVVGYCRPSD